MKRYLNATLLMTLFCTAAFAADPAQSLGVVNFSSCISDSKLGMQEQATFEALKKQMANLLEETEKQLNDLTAKFNDPDYLDGLSPEAEEDLKNKFRSLNEDLNRYQNQYYQVMNQANMRVVQTLSNSITTASEKVAKDKKLSAVLNKEALFYFAPALDVTKLIIAEMDRTFVPEKKGVAAPTANATEETHSEQQTK